MRALRRQSFLILALLVLPAAAPDDFTITVRPRVTPTGGTVHIVCRIPKKATHRKLRIELEHEQATDRELAGANAKVFHELWIDEVSACGELTASCEITDHLGKKTKRLQTLRVIGAGCPADDPESLPFP